MLEEDPDCHLILTDYQMPPGMDGLEFAVKAKDLYSKKLQKQPPLIALCTADYSTEVTVECAKAGIGGKIQSVTVLIVVDCPCIFLVVLY